MKILLVTCNGMNNGGVQSIIMAMLRTLKQKEQKVDILSFSGKACYYDKEISKLNVKHHRIKLYDGSNSLLLKFFYFFRSFKISKKFNKILNNNYYDCVFCFNEFEAGILAKISRKHHVKKIIVEASTTSLIKNKIKNYRNKKLQNYINRYADVKIAPSQPAGYKLFGDSDFCIIKPGYDNNKYYYVDNKEPNNLNLVQIGKFCSNKNQIFTIDVFDKIHSHIPNSNLFLIGFDATGEYKQKLLSEIRKKNLSKNVFLLEHADNKEFLSKSCYFAFPSLSESFGIVLAEAQACGLKCVCSNLIPKDSNCGGCVYLALDSEIWSKLICDDYLKNKGLHFKYDCEFIKNDYVINERLNKIFLK